MQENNNSKWIIATVVAALGYFVDVYDLWLFSIVRTSSLSSLGVTGDALISTGVFLINTQLIGMMIGTIGIGITMIVLIMLWMGMSMPSFY